MQRLNFTFDDATVQLLDRLANEHFRGNKSLTVRAALESLASHAGHPGWVIGGYVPVEVNDLAACHTCGDAYQKGTILYRPVFERGESAAALPRIPSENWLDCPQCVEETVT
jgi:hypothetical protein